MMRVPPQSLGVLPSGFGAVLSQTFRTGREYFVLLGGSCALAEFYLAHRCPHDIDLFWKSRAEMNALTQHLLGMWPNSVRDPRPAAGLVKLLVHTDSGPVPVHSAMLKQRWARPDLAKQCSLDYGIYTIPTLEYLALEKLVAISDHTDSGSRATSLYDLLAIRAAGIPVQAMADMVEFARPSIRLCDMVRHPPRHATIDGLPRHIGEDARDFLAELTEEWHSRQLTQLIGDLAD